MKAFIKEFQYSFNRNVNERVQRKQGSQLQGIIFKKIP